MIPQEILKIPEETREYANHLAYEHVLDGRDPLYVNDEYYMLCYVFWKAIGPNDDFLF